MDTQKENCPWCGSEISHEQFEDITARIREEEQAAFVAFKEQAEAAAKQTAEAAALKKVKAAQAERDAALEAKRTAAETMKKMIAEATKTTEQRLKKEYQEDIQAQRVVLDKERDKLLAQAEAERTRDREAHRADVAELQRKLAAKTANEIGDGAHIDLLEKLKEAFPDDKFDSIQKGVAGADIRQKVIHNGMVCGSILFDSKARNQWKTDHATKLRQDQLEDGANHAVLASLKFPAGEKELCIYSDVIVVGPCRAVHVVTLLRESLIGLHVLGLSSQQRDSKTARLYEYITSNACRHQFAELDRIKEELQAIDVDEANSHKKVWLKRGQLLVKQGRQLMSIRTQFTNIIECTDYFESADDAEHNEGDQDQADRQAIAS